MNLPGIVNFDSFVAAGVLLNLTPGNDTIFILSRSLAQGRRAGIASALGISAGSLIHTTLAAFGLSIIIAKSLIVFSILKLAGAAYLIFLGLRMIFARSVLNMDRGVKSRNEDNLLIFRDALLTNVLNPKVALFFIAFLPQFIDPAYPGKASAFLLLGLTFTTTGTIWCLILAFFASLVYSRLCDRPAATLWLNRICGSVLVGLGIKLAISGKK